MIVIVGAGPAGIAAAIQARKRQAKVTVIDDNSTPGGQIWRGDYRFNDGLLKFISSARVVQASAADKTLIVETSEAALTIPYDKLILATGARELFLPFPGWTLPNVFGAGGLQALAKGGLPLRHKRIAVAGSGPLLLAAAAYFRRRGAQVVLIAEQASMMSIARFGRELLKHSAKLSQAVALQAELLGIPYRFGCWPVRADGAGRVERVWFQSGSGSFAEEVDYAAIAWGLVPNTELAAALGCRTGNAVDVDEFQRTSIESIFCAGEATGIGGVELSEAEGAIAGSVAADDVEGGITFFPKRSKALAFAGSVNTAFALREELRALAQPDTIICRCEDVIAASLTHCRSTREARLHTRCGMGACQGRVCGAATRFLFGWGVDTVRTPLSPARCGTLICSSQP